MLKPLVEKTLYCMGRSKSVGPGEEQFVVENGLLYVEGVKAKWLVVVSTSGNPLVLRLPHTI